MKFYLHFYYPTNPRSWGIYLIPTFHIGYDKYVFDDTIDTLYNFTISWLHFDLNLEIIKSK